MKQLLLFIAASILIMTLGFVRRDVVAPVTPVDTPKYQHFYRLDVTDQQLSAVINTLYLSGSYIGRTLITDSSDKYRGMQESALNFLRSRIRLDSTKIK